MIKLKWIFALLGCLLITGIQAQAVWNNSTFVHRSNKQILDGQNSPISLNGVNLGGWLLWEGWIWGGGYTQQKTIYNNIKTVIGTSAADAFTDSVNRCFISRQDIKKISEQCYNVVRIPFNSSLLEDDLTPYVYKPAGWAVLDSVLAWCEAYNVYAVLDMHSAPGGQSNAFTADPDLFINLWNGAINQKRTKLMWKAIAGRYKNRGIIAAYDLLNEPNVSSDSVLIAMYNDITDSIRTVDQNHMLSIEGNNFATDFSMFTTLHDPNTSFQFHFYTWFFNNAIASHLAPFTAFSNSINAPIWCGEWGENNYQPIDTTRKLLSDPAYGVSGSAFWTWKKMRIGSSYPFYNGIDTSYAWTKSITWICNTSAPQPTAAEMQAGIASFIHNARIAQCVYNDTMSKAVGTCYITGIETYVPDVKEIKVYPQPATDQLNIAFDNGLVIQSVGLGDMQGRVLTVPVLLANHTASADVRGLAPGVYMCRVALRDGRSFVCKVVKQ